MNPIGIRDEDKIGSRELWFEDRRATQVRSTAERVRVVRRFGGRDGRDGGGLLEGAAAVGRRRLRLDVTIHNDQEPSARDLRLRRQRQRQTAPRSKLRAATSRS